MIREDIAWGGRSGQQLRQEIHQSQRQAQRKPQRTLKGDLKRIGGWVKSHLLERYCLLWIMFGAVAATNLLIAAVR